MKFMYIAGPYRASTVAGVRQNIENARQVAEYWVKKPGWYPITPHLNTAFMDGLVEDEKFLSGALQLLKICDAICLIDGWQTSDGTKKEISQAMQQNIPIFIKNGNIYEIHGVKQ